MWPILPSTPISIDELKLQLRLYAKKVALVEREKLGSSGGQDKLIEERLKQLLTPIKGPIAVFSPLKHEPSCFIDLEWWNKKPLMLPMAEGGWVSKLVLQDGSSWPNTMKKVYLASEIDHEKPHETPSAILVPGLLFSDLGCRLGLGKGWFDRSMDGMKAVRIGVCYEWAVQSFIPCEPHDLLMDWIVTERRTIKCKS